MPLDDPFDHDRVWYRVLGDEDAPGYSYSRGEPATMATGEGLRVAPEPIFEFDPLELVGAWLHLGARVRRLRVPREASVVRSRPMGQGGCYTWRADRVELLDILPDYPSLMREYATTGAPARRLHFSGYLFPAGFPFPRRVQQLVLQGCLAVDPLDFPAWVETLRIFDCALHVGRAPEIAEELVARDSYFEGVAATAFACPSVELTGCTFRAIP